MTTKEQIEANRRNGKLSRGPTTAEGRAVSAKNALKHGLLSQNVVLPDEDSYAYAAMAERVNDQFNPVGELECALVMMIISLIWRGQRAARIESGILAYRYYGILGQRAAEEIGKHVETDLDRRSKQDDSHNKITNPAEYQAALIRRDNLLSEQGSDDATLGLAFIQDSEGANSLSKLSRYETAIERRLYKAIQELRRLQTGRKGQVVAPAEVIDIDVTGMPD
jgi:hypothetical protein